MIRNLNQRRRWKSPRQKAEKEVRDFFFYVFIINLFLSSFFLFFFFVVEESFKWMMKTMKERRIFFMGRSSTNEKLKTDYLHGKIGMFFFFFSVLAVVLLLSVSCRNTPFFFNVFSSLSGVF